MNYQKLIAVILVLLSINSFAQNLNDTIRVTIHLKQLNSLGLKIEVQPPSDLKGIVNYQFPKTIPGIYEFLSPHESIIDLWQQSEKINCTDNSFSINCDATKPQLNYNAKSTVNEYVGISAEDTYYLKDSIYILNWHYLLGFFQEKTNRPYSITIYKNTNLLGTGSLTKNTQNDSTDIYTANNYKELIHGPILYSIPDTTTFNVGTTKFTISCAGYDTLLNAQKIKDLLISPLSYLLKESNNKPQEYSFLFYSEYALATPYLTGLEHPNSTLICYHSAFSNNNNNNNILVSCSVHEFIHAIYAPLSIRSEIINDFKFINPICDEYLWFYEGVTEYLSIKTLLDCGFFSQSDFLNELNESNIYHKDINFNDVSAKIYEKKEQKLFDNFYTTGSLFALQLDMEIIKRSTGETDLFKVMQELQKKYNPNKPFNSTNFNKEFSVLSGVELHEYILKNVSKKTKINFTDIVEELGFTQKFSDTLIWSYSPKKTYLILNYRKDRLEYAMFGSTINTELKSKKVTIYNLNTKPLTWFNSSTIMSPNNGKEVSLKANIGKETIEFKTKPTQIIKENLKVDWLRNENYDSELAKKYWNN